nr:YetF domain-containing protein [Roseivivax sp. GX 12232]
MAPLRTRVDWLRRLIDARPVLVMRDGEILWDGMMRANVTREDLMAKLRQSNVHDLSDVKAVVVESTGVVSVVQNTEGRAVSEALLADVVEVAGPRGREAPGRG